MQESGNTYNYIDNIDISITDWRGVIKDGVGVLLKMKIIDNLTFDFFYWFNKKGQYKFIADDDFLKLMNLNNIHEYKYLSDLKKYIDTKILPKREKIWNEFNL